MRVTKKQDTYFNVILATEIMVHMRTGGSDRQPRKQESVHVVLQRNHLKHGNEKKQKTKQNVILPSLPTPLSLCPLIG